MNRVLYTVLPLLVGVVLLAATIAHIDLNSFGTLVAQIGVALPILLMPSAAWHVLRTLAWRACFPSAARPPFGRMFRVRLAAEAFSWVTISGVAGEPLKVVLLESEERPAVVAAAVALERVVYVLSTFAVIALVSIVALQKLPLTSAWAAVFTGFAVFATGLIAALLWLFLRRSPDESGGAARKRRSRAVRFVLEMNEHMRRAVRDEPRRLIHLILLHSAAYGLMALEVWAVFRFVRVPIGVDAAFAVETLTRVASMAAAFIPANLGALEASNVAAAAAVHASGGAAALAVTRRLRGLFWAAAGFLIYPGGFRRGRGSRAARRSGDALVVLEDSHSRVPVSSLLGGMPIAERLLRAAGRAGFSRVLVWAPEEKPVWEAISSRLPSIEVSVTADREVWRALLQDLGADSQPIVITSSEVPSPQLLEAVRGSSPVDAATANDVLHVATPDDLHFAERRLRESIHKSTDGVLGRFNRNISIPISVALVRTMRLSPHAMSALIFVAGLYAGWLFGRGNYLEAVAGAAVSLAASILDGCDGELARLQYADSAFGCWVDTIGDYLYYLSIFAGLTIGISRQPGWESFWWVGVLLLAGSILTFALLIVLRGRITSGRPERLRTATRSHFESAGKPWMAFVSRISMCATRATMPYGLLVFAVLNLLPAFVVLAAVGAHMYWISLALQLKNLLSLTPPPFADSSSRKASASA